MLERKNGTEPAMVQPVIVCPHCQKEIRLTESLAAPLVEQILADKDSEVAKREAEVRKQEKAIAEAEKTVDDRIAQGIRKERERIAAEEGKCSSSEPLRPAWPRDQATLSGSVHP